MLAHCLFMAMIIVYAATPGLETYLPATTMYDGASLTGVCSDMSGDLVIEVEINDSHQLILVWAQSRFVIPLPPKPGRWPLRYRLGSEHAIIEPWGRIQVRFGPKDEI